MTTSLKDVQQAIYQTLLNDSVIDSLTVGVYDDVPADTDYPYIAVGEAEETPFNTFDRIGRDSIFTLHIFSDYRGYKESYEILERMNELLDYKEITITNWQAVYLRYETTNAMKEGGDIRHLAVDYRAIVQEE